VQIEMREAYTAIQKHVPKYGRLVSAVVEKNIQITERFFDHRYKRSNLQDTPTGNQRSGFMVWRFSYAAKRAAKVLSR